MCAELSIRSWKRAFSLNSPGLHETECGSPPRFSPLSTDLPRAQADAIVRSQSAERRRPASVTLRRVAVERRGGRRLGRRDGLRRLRGHWLLCDGFRPVELAREDRIVAVE